MEFKSEIRKSAELLYTAYQKQRNGNDSRTNKDKFISASAGTYANALIKSLNDRQKEIFEKYQTTITDLIRIENTLAIEYILSIFNKDED